MIGTEIRTAAGGSGTHAPEEHITHDNHEDPRWTQIPREEGQVDRTAEQQIRLIAGIGEYAVQPLGISTREGAGRRHMPVVLGRTATVRYAPFRIV